MTQNHRPGTLWLIPTPLGEASDPLTCLPAATRSVVCRLDYLIAESAKSARAFLKHLPLDRPIQEIEIRELNEHTPESSLNSLLAPVLSGRDAGVLSEAGCPAIADPGAALVSLAHREQVRVRPLIGPSSVLLALMASGLQGQRFAFVGYLPQASDERLRAARALEERSSRNDETILLIETPYRNQTLFDALVDSLAPSTQVSIASALTLDEEFIATRSVQEWRQARPSFEKVPTVFGIYAQPKGRGDRSHPSSRGAQSVDRRNRSQG